MNPFDVRIDSIAAGGDGVGRHEGLVVFVPRTAPGDLVRVAATQEGRLMRGRALELLERSADRVEPPCAHYVADGCGGCQLQHIAYDAQRHAKSVIVRDAMTRIARAPVDAPDVQRSDSEWRYRTKLTLKLQRVGEDWMAGLHRYDAPGEIFALVDCPITDERVLSHWRDVLAHRALLPHARELRGAVRLLERGVSFTLEGGRTWPACRQFFDAVPALEELWWMPEGQRRRRVASRAAHTRAGASFMQVNPGVAETLRRYMLGVVERHAPATVVDAYAGTGDTAVALADAGRRVTAIEVDRDAARLCATRLPTGSSAVAATVEVAISDVLPADLVLLNPPRAGVHARVTEVLSSAAGTTRAVIYVSCNPATLARDVRRLEGWRVASLRSFDMFPQTAHVETVCELVPRR